MLGTLPHALQKFFGFVGASLTGITALFTAMGFLAERARLTMLGLPATAFDLQQYLETGARMFAFLPIYLGTALLLTISDLLGLGLESVVATPEAARSAVEPAFAPPLPPNAQTGAVAETLHVGTSRGLDGSTATWLVVLLTLSAAMALLWKYRAQWQPSGGLRLRKRAAVARTAIGAFARRHRTLLLLFFLLVQFGGACQQARTIRVHDLLFEAAPAYSTQTPTPLLFIGTDTLERWVRGGHYEPSVQYLGALFLLTLLTAWGLYRVFRVFDRSTTGTWERAWMVASLLLLVSQVTLLPINYGILLSSNRFPSVCVDYGARSSEAVLPPDERIALVHETDNGYYLYAPPQRRMWYVQRASVEALRYFGMTDVLAAAPLPQPCR